MIFITDSRFKAAFQFFDLNVEWKLVFEEERFYPFDFQEQYILLLELGQAMGDPLKEDDLLLFSCNMIQSIDKNYSLAVIAFQS